MRGREHLMLGAAIGASVIAATQNYNDGFVLMGACMLGSLYPDIDLPSSKLGHIFKPISGLLNESYGHRGFIHTPLNAALVTVIYWSITYLTAPWMFWPAAFGFLIGFFAHLLQDTFTKGGIMWLYPLKVKIHFTNIKSDSIACFFITIALICGWIGLLRMCPNLISF